MAEFRSWSLAYIVQCVVLVSFLSCFIAGCKSRSLSSPEGFTDERYAPLPLKLESAYNNLNDLSASVIEGGATSARLEVAYSVLEQRPGEIQADVDGIIAGLSKGFRDRGLVSAGSRDRTPDGFENKTITNIHLLEYYAKSETSDQVNIDGDIAALSQNSNAFSEPRCDVSKALRDELLTDSEWRKVERRFAGSTPLIPHRLKVRSRYYLYSPRKTSGAGASAPAITQIPRHFRMESRNMAGASEPLIAKNQLVKFFEVKMSTAQMPVGGSCAFLIRKHRLALLGSEPWLKNGYRYDDVSVLTDAQSVGALSALYRLASDSQAYQASSENEKYARFLSSDLATVKVGDKALSRFDLSSMLASFLRGALTTEGVALDYDRIRERYTSLASSPHSKGMISAFDLFVDGDKAKKFLSSLPVGGRDDAGNWSWDSKNFAEWLSNWRVRTLITNLYYAKDVKYLGASDKLDSTGFSGTDIQVLNSKNKVPNNAEIDAWFRSFSALSAGIDKWSMAMLKAQERYFRYTGERGMPVLKTRAYDRRSWEIRASSLSDKAFRADSNSSPLTETVQITLDRNLEILVPQAIDRKLSTFINYPLRLNVIEFKFPIHHLENTLPNAAQRSQVFGELRKIRDAYAGMDSRNSEGNQGKGKRPEGVLLWDFPNNPAAQFAEYLNSAEGVACRVGGGLARKAAKDCFVTGLALRRFFSTMNIRLFDGYLRKQPAISIGYEGDDGLQLLDGVPAGEIPLQVSETEAIRNHFAGSADFEDE